MVDGVKGASLDVRCRLSSVSYYTALKGYLNAGALHGHIYSQSIMIFTRHWTCQIY